MTTSKDDREKASDLHVKKDRVQEEAQRLSADLSRDQLMELVDWLDGWLYGRAVDK
jgi:hypothetical protein